MRSCRQLLETDMEEDAALLCRHRTPAFGTLVAVDSDFRSPHRGGREARHDEGKMAGTGDHRVCAVGGTLRRTARVRVDISDDGNAAPLAVVPKWAKVTTVEADDACVQTCRIEVIVEHELHDPDAASATTA